MCRIVTCPAGPIPCPCVILGPGVAKSAEKDDVLSGGIVGHGRRFEMPGRNAWTTLLPPRAIPYPGVRAARSANRVSSVEHDLGSRRVIGHRRTISSGRTGGGLSLGPGFSVPRPGVAEQHPGVAPAQEDHLFPIGLGSPDR